MSEQTTGYTAEDMADQAASQFRAGYESAKRGDPEPLSNGGAA